MSCRQPNVQRAAEKAGERGKAAVAKLENDMIPLYNKWREDFNGMVNQSWTEQGITDARSLGDTKVQFKTEFSTEFSLDKIADVVVKALKAAAIALDESKPDAYLSSDAMNAYADVVAKVAEAAKSSSQASNSLAYSVTPLGRGTYAYLLAKADSITDSETFGDETVSCTAFIYKVYQSKDMLKADADFSNEMSVDDANVKNVKDLLVIQSNLIGELSSGKLTIKQYSKKNENMENLIAGIRAKIDPSAPKAGAAPVAMAARGATVSGYHETEVHHKLEEKTHNALAMLSADNSDHAKIIETTKAKLAAGHFAF